MLIGAARLHDRRAGWRPPYTLHLGKIGPESPETFCAAKQRREDCRVREQGIAATVALWRHPDQRIELSVPRGRKRMRPLQIDRLRAQYVDRLRVVGRQSVVREMQMEIERGHSVQQAAFIQFSVDGQGRNLLGSLDHRRPEPELIHYGDAKAFHE